MDLKPIDDQIVVAFTEEVTSNGVILPVPRDPTGPKYAKVAAVGPGRPSEYTGTLIPMPPGVVVGATVLMHGGAGTKVKREGVEYRFIRRGDIMAIAPVPSAQ